MKAKSKTKKKTKPKNIRPGQYKRSVQEFVEHDYHNGVYNQFGQEVIRPLTREEIDFKLQFEQEWYLNDRTFENPLLGEDYYKEISDNDNQRRRDIYNIKSNHLEFDPRVLNNIEDNIQEGITEMLKVMGYKETLNNVIDECVETILTLDNYSETKEEIIQLVSNVQLILKEQVKYDRQQNKLKKDNKKSS